MKTFTFFIGSLCWAVILHAQIIHVPADQPTIQAGIDAANEGDTVLVNPGTFFENISWGTNNITLASLFLITQDTSFIPQTVIDGNNNGPVIQINGGDSTARICGFTIQNGFYNAFGAGIICYSSDLTLENLRVISNQSVQPQNYTEGGYGGGVCILGGKPRLKSLLISDNSASGNGGGIYCDSDACPKIENVIVTRNTASAGGGAHFDYSSQPVLNNVVFMNNSAISGGGIYIRHASPFLSGVKVINNTSYFCGGGLYIDEGALPVFDSIHKCDVYLNSGVHGNDVYSNIKVAICLDTFSVLHPTSFYAKPLGNFTFNIEHGIIEQFNADLYVSPEGDNSNTGLTPEDPLRNIYQGIKKLFVDSLDPHTLHLMQGIYSPSSNDEHFPINIPEYISLFGISKNEVILNAEGTAGVITLYDNLGTTLSGLTITGGGGINCINSSPVLKSLIITGNSSWGGGGVSLSNSYPVFDSVDRCSVFLNSGYKGVDFYSINSDTSIRVFLDTFTVIQPTKYHAYPLSSFAFDIISGMLSQTSQDQYVSPEGDNYNEGLTANEPLKNISRALSKSLPDSLHPQTIHLLPGTFSNSSNGEFFPVVLNDYLSLEGVSEDSVILDGEEHGLPIISIPNGSRHNIVSGMTITRGTGSGIWSGGTNSRFLNITVKNNRNGSRGGGMVIFGEGSMVADATIINNSARESGGGMYCGDNVILENTIISDNVVYGNAIDEGYGGGICCGKAILKNVLISGNSASHSGGGIYGNPDLTNVTIIGNEPYGIVNDMHGGMQIRNSIIRDNLTREILFHLYGNDTLLIEFSNIENGIEGISGDLDQIKWLDGNVDVDPLFSAIDDHPFSLLPGSPCIDAGTPDTLGLFLPLHDILGNPRIWNNRIDMGAYEWNNVGVEEFQDSRIQRFQISVYPNPSRGIVDCRLLVPKATPEGSVVGCQFVSLKIYDVHGREVATVLDRKLPAGEHVVRYDMTGMSTGIYYYRLQAGNQISSGKMILIK
jgi:predicted outer membrane repeat protein